MSIAIAKRYADALGEVIDKPSVETDATQALAQLKSFEDLVDRSRELRLAFSSPAVDHGDKRAVIRELAGRLDLSTPVKNFLLVLADNSRLDLLDEIGDALQGRVDDEMNIARLEITSARPLPGDQQQQIMSHFAGLLGREIRAEFVEDAELLGGVKVRHGSTVYDGSVRTQLDRLEDRIAGEV